MERGPDQKRFYVHKAVFKNNVYHKTKCRPFRLSPLEKQIIAKYLKNLCENDIIKPVADGHAGVNLFLVGKHSPGDSGDKEGNEGWKNLKKEYERDLARYMESSIPTDKKSNVIPKKNIKNSEDLSTNKKVEKRNTLMSTKNLVNEST